MTYESNPEKRILKIEEVGDFWKKRTTPRIRLRGKWLAKAGFLPSNYVQVESPMPGVLIIQLMEKND